MTLIEFFGVILVPFLAVMLGVAYLYYEFYYLPEIKNKNKKKIG